MAQGSLVRARCVDVDSPEVHIAMSAGMQFTTPAVAQHMQQPAPLHCTHPAVLQYAVVPAGLAAAAKSTAAQYAQSPVVQYTAAPQQLPAVHYDALAQASFTWAVPQTAAAASAACVHSVADGRGAQAVSFAAPSLPRFGAPTVFSNYTTAMPQAAWPPVSSVGSAGCAPPQYTFAAPPELPPMAQPTKLDGQVAGFGASLESDT